MIIGVGWAGSIMANELAKAGLKVVGLERGRYRGQEEFALPGIHDELKYNRRLELFEDLSRSTITCRNNTGEVAPAHAAAWTVSLGRRTGRCRFPLGRLDVAP